MSSTIGLCGVLLILCIVGATAQAPKIAEKHQITCEGWDGYNENNSTMRMKCPEGTVIQFTFANYGRTKLHKEVCETQRKDCDYSDTSTPVVQALCDNKVKCEVNASNDVFTNQCALTYKYLEIKYKCVNAANPQGRNLPERITTVCEHSTTINTNNYTARPDCGDEPGTWILTTWANWGRLVDYELLCNPEPEVTNCTRNAIPGLVRCARLNACEIDARNENFAPDPCPGTYKYLEVRYRCIEDSGAFVGPSVLLLAITGVLVSLFATDM